MLLHMMLLLTFFLLSISDIDWSSLSAHDSTPPAASDILLSVSSAAEKSSVTRRQQNPYPRNIPTKIYVYLHTNSSICVLGLLFWYKLRYKDKKKQFFFLTGLKLDWWGRDPSTTGFPFWRRSGQSPKRNKERNKERMDLFCLVFGLTLETINIKINTPKELWSTKSQR